MIHDIAAAVDAELKTKKCPIRIVLDAERTKATTYARERILFEEDDDAGDTFGPIHTPQKNPRPRMLSNVGAKITIFAQAANAGTAQWEHRRRARHVLDLVLVALDKVLKGKKQGYALSKGGFVKLADLESSESVSGAVYELSLSIERNVFEQTWAGDKRPEATIGVDVAVSNTVRAAIEGSGEYETVIEG